MRTYLIASLAQSLMLLSDRETLRRIVGHLLDIVEAQVALSENKFDDALVLPLCAKLRAELDLPDDDDVPAEARVSSEAR